MQKESRELTSSFSHNLYEQRRGSIIMQKEGRELTSPFSHNLYPRGFATSRFNMAVLTWRIETSPGGHSTSLPLTPSRIVTWGEAVPKLLPMNLLSRRVFSIFTVS